MKLTFALFALTIIGLGSIIAMLAWMLKKAIQHQDEKPEKPDSPEIPKGYKRWVPDEEEERRMRE